MASHKSITLGLLFFLFLGFGLFLARDSLAHPWFWDDYHLIRTFSTPELVQVFVGTWDPDYLETRAYRPGTTLFNHLRALGLGENVVAQRVFSLGLFAMALVLWGMVAMQLGAPPRAAALAGIIALASQNNWYHLIWIADGVHNVVMVYLGCSALLLLSYVRSPRIWKLILCIVAAMLALFTREESIPLVIILPCIGIYAALAASPIENFSVAEIRAVWHNRNRVLDAKLLGCLIVGIVLLALTLFYFLLRARFVSAFPMDVRVSGWVTLIYWTLYPMGLPKQMVNDESVFLLWTFLLFCLALCWLALRERRTQVRIGFWFTCALLASLQGLVLVRPNVLFFPILFFSLALAELLFAMAQQSRALLGAAVLIACFVILTSANHNLISQQLVHPSSLYYLYTAFDFAYGNRAKVVKIPPARRALLETILARANIYSAKDYAKIYPRLVKQAKRKKWDMPTADGRYFMPRIPFLAP